MYPKKMWLSKFNVETSVGDVPAAIEEGNLRNVEESNNGAEVVRVEERNVEENADDLAVQEATLVPSAMEVENLRNIEEGNNGAEVVSVEERNVEENADDLAVQEATLVPSAMEVENLRNIEEGNNGAEAVRVEERNVEENADELATQEATPVMFTITRESQSVVRQFNITGRRIEFRVNDLPEGENPVSWFRRAVNQVITYVTRDVEPDDRIGLSFCSKDFLEKNPGWIPFRAASSFKFEDVWCVLNSVFQSNANSMNTDTFCMNITIVKIPTGKGSSKRNSISYEDRCKKSKAIITVHNNDNLCLPRALVTAIAQYSHDNVYKKNIRTNKGNAQTILTNQLMSDAAVIIPTNGAGIPEIKKFEDFLKEYHITVYKYGGNNSSKGRDIVYESKNSKDLKKINLLYHDNHYNVIKSLTAVFCCGYYCDNCHVAYNNKNAHRCYGKCYNCWSSPPCKKSNGVSCRICKRSFVSQQCFENHLAQSSDKASTCQTIKKCTKCLKTVRATREHTCGEIFCAICRKHQPGDHLCYIQPNKQVLDLQGQLFIFYDLETRQEKLLQGTESKVHEPNLCVLNKRCDTCIRDENINICTMCGTRQEVLRIKPIERFIEYVMNQRAVFKQIICIAHNGQAFDHQFILNTILKKTRIAPEIIQRGTKILMMKIDNIKFIDSLNYFPMKLSLLPKAFDLGENYKKGYFPHLFNTLENENYIGELPSINFYMPDSMVKDERDKFLQWHAENSESVFDLQRELVDYCKSDVDILTHACLKFRKDFIDKCDVCPFTEAITIASACNLVYRRNFLKPQSIGIIPTKGYRGRDNHSRIATHWILWQEQQHNIRIKHAATGREQIILGVKVDGYCEETKQIFEFHGCYYHGHPECMTSGRNIPLGGNKEDTLESRFIATEAKTLRLRQKGYNVIEKWECHFREEMLVNHEIQNLENHVLLKCTPLNPRDAFYGGRTDNIRKYYKIEDGERIKYIDVCSLYPWVCKYGKFPVGHPKLHIGDEECKNINLKDISGLIKCSILPPQDLFHPVLPYKQNNKLMFLLCSKCGETFNQSECPHRHKQRALHGTWTIDEVVKAVEKGYKIQDISEIWEYKVEQYDPVTKTGGLFTEMMDTFLEMKQAASGFPPSCSTPEQKEAYIEEFFRAEGILMKLNEILKNAGLRSLAKLMLNSFWGKFGQRENLPKTVIINQPKFLYEMLLNPAINVNNILIINEDTLAVNWEYIEEEKESLHTINVCIAAFTTAQARLKLYEYLESLGERVLYYDTDSVIYISKEGLYEPPLGNCIGDMTDELTDYGQGSYITEFASGGPKNYALKIWSTNESKEMFLCKVKGISLNYSVSQIINFDSIKNIIINEDQNDKIEIIGNHIRRIPYKEVITKTESKIYKPVCLKRRFVDISAAAPPIGFKKRKRITLSLSVK